MQLTTTRPADIARQVNELDALAKTHANQAVDYARQAGELLLGVKAQLPHGTWMTWVSENLSVSHRQALRYIDVASGKPISVRNLTGKLDMVSNLVPRPKDQGVWKDGRWLPNKGVIYLFNEDGATYWVLPSVESKLWFHVCKHYRGARMSTEGFSRRYTIFAPVDDTSLTSEQYVGTTTPLGWLGVGEVLASYGLKGFADSLVFSDESSEGFSRPFGEPSAEKFFEDWHHIEGLKGERSATA